MRRANLFIAMLFELSTSIAFAQGSATEPFVVGIGRSIHDSTGVSAALNELGVQSVRLDVPWAEVETAPGVYAMPAWIDRAVDDARAMGIDTLVILAYGHPSYGNDKPQTPQAIAAFVRYAQFVVSHFKGRVHLYDLWNEWETHTGHTTPGTPEGYIALASRAYPEIKAMDVNAVVLSGGMLGAGLDSGWLPRFFELGGLQFVDALSIHPYNYQRVATDAPERAIDLLERIDTLAHRYAGSRMIRLYVTEMGYPNHLGKGGIAADAVAMNLVRFYLLASARPDVAGVWWYCLRDQGADRTDKEQNFGVMDYRLVSKPAARPLQQLAQVLKEVGRFRDDSTGSERRVSGQRSNGVPVVLTWDERAADARLLADLAALVARPQSPAALSTDSR